MWRSFVGWRQTKMCLWFKNLPFMGVSISGGLMNDLAQMKWHSKALLMLDGSSARLKNTDVLESAEGHNITFLCVPSHAAQALEPLSCAF
jgi:hypothetical protein